MKKNLSVLILPVLLIIAMLAIGCGGDDNPTPASRDKDIESYEAKLNAFIADPTNVAKCNALKASLNELVDCPGITAGQKKQYQDEVDDIDCD